MTPLIIDRGRGPEIVGTRITVYDILDYSTAGWHQTAIAATLRLSSEQVLTALKYIEEHKIEVMADYQEMLANVAKGNPPEVQVKIDAAHVKFQAKVQERRAAKARENPHEGNSVGRQ